MRKCAIAIAILLTAVASTNAQAQGRRGGPSEDQMRTAAFFGFLSLFGGIPITIAATSAADAAAAAQAGPRRRRGKR